MSIQTKGWKQGHTFLSSFQHLLRIITLRQALNGRQRLSSVALLDSNVNVVRLSRFGRLELFCSLAYVRIIKVDIRRGERI